ncbi:MAG: Inosine/uridine-preferring nucleoside hydrolase [Ilumatobacteraceae bacterium]|nr:Inosine/uridine-preferring nucleoside hydrolase [Ilumatobacteraceae bacterium]
MTDGSTELPDAPTGTKTKLVIDSDGGVDDAVAIWWAATSPDVELVAITTVHGNVDLGTATDNVCRVLEACGAPTVPVAAGRATAIGPAPELRPATFIHGDDGLGNTYRPKAAFGAVAEHAVDMLLRIVREQPGELVLVPIGPLSNIAAAIRADPTWATKVKRLVVMGGAALTQGNALPIGEANIAHDPTAADVVATAAWTTPPLLVGLDVTHLATFTTAEVALVQQHNTAAGVFLDAPLACYSQFGGTFCAPGEFPCHDALAVMAAVHPEMVGGPVLPMGVQVAPGPALGATVIDRRVTFFAKSDGGEQTLPDGFSPWQIGLEVDVDAFRAQLRRLFTAS